jgi:hypothetical protein
MKPPDWTQMPDDSSVLMTTGPVVDVTTVRGEPPYVELATRVLVTMMCPDTEYSCACWGGGGGTAMYHAPHLHSRRLTIPSGTRCVPQTTSSVGMEATRGGGGNSL